MSSSVKRFEYIPAALFKTAVNAASPILGERAEQVVRSFAEEAYADSHSYGTREVVQKFDQYFRHLLGDALTAEGIHYANAYRDILGFAE